MNIFRALPIEMNDLILGFLSPIELIAIKSTSREFYEISKKQIKKKMDKYLNGIDPIVRRHLNNNIMLSGSTVLGLLHQEHYPNSDLDVYINNIADDGSGDLIDFQDITRDIIHDLWDNGYTRRTAPMYPGNLINVIDFIKEDCPKIQLIISDCIIETINNFDLDIVQNCFNGSDIHIKYPDSVRTRTINTINISDFRTSNPRIQKYQKRGYAIASNNFDELDSEHILNWREGPGNYHDIKKWITFKFFDYRHYSTLRDKCMKFAMGILCPDRKQKIIDIILTELPNVQHAY